MSTILPNLTINTSSWQQGKVNATNKNIIMISTDGEVKTKNKITYDVPGYGVLSWKYLGKTEIMIHGRGQRSCSTECFAIYEALGQLGYIEKNKILILTDC